MSNDKDCVPEQRANAFCCDDAIEMPELAGLIKARLEAILALVELEVDGTPVEVTSFSFKRQEEG